MIVYEGQRFGESDEILITEWSDMHYPIPHFHRSYEFIYLYNGQMEVLLDDDRAVLDAGQSMLVFPNQIHAYYALQRPRVKMAIFSPQYIGRFYHQFLHRRPAVPVFRLSDDTLKFVLSKLTSEANEYDIKGCLYAICGDIVRSVPLNPTQVGQNDTLAHRLLEFMEQNYSQKVTLAHAAKKLGYSYQYLSRYFNHQFGLHFGAMLNQYRVERAVYLLKNTSDSITSIASECGFDNLRSFNRNFKIITRQTPRQFRKPVSDSV